jgi:hypothetical protein
VGERPGLLDLRDAAVRWLPAWSVLGAGFVVGVISVIGVIVLPIVIVLIVLLSRVRSARPAHPGVVAGFGLPLLYVAWLNRRGPGNVCKTFANGESCVEQMSPWPWFALGAGLLATGILLAVIWHVRRRGV